MARSPRSPAADRLFDLPRPVWLLGWVSLATDAATEAVYPLLPFFLTQVLGAGAVSLGIIEGAAEAVNSLLKVWSGRVADRRTTKRPLVLLGYSVSSFVRPLIAVAQSWTHVFAVRVADRVGKGIRSAPRDALLAANATPHTRGKVFGFHNAMDHLGAVVGPVMATLFLLAYPGAYRALFALTIVPGAIAVLLILLIREAPVVGRGESAAESAEPIERRGQSAAGAGESVVGRGQSAAPSAEPNGGRGFCRADSSRSAARFPRELTTFFIVLALFTLGNSTDAFLLLRLTNIAGSAKYIPLMWAGLHVVKAIVSLLAGRWSDRIGRRSVIALGWIVYALVYVGFAVSTTLVSLLGWFLIYGFYFGFAEGAEKALVADLAPQAIRGFAFGVYNAVLGIGALLASVLFGALWTAFGTAIAFGTGAALALVATVLLFFAVRR
jgi:MFS family permease